MATGIASGSGPLELNDLINVNLSGESNLDSLKYDASTGKWTNVNDPTQLAGIGIFQDTNAKGGIQQIAIETLGNSTFFANNLTSRSACAANSSSTRMIFSGAVPAANTMEYCIYAAPATSINFGNLTVIRVNATEFGNETVACIAGGNATTNVDTVNPATTANATVFGTASVSPTSAASVSSKTRGILTGGNNGVVISDYIDYWELSTGGAFTDFGNMLGVYGNPSGVSNNTIGLIAVTLLADTSVDSLTIATTNSAASFGDLSAGRFHCGGASSPIRAVFGGGADSGSHNVIDYRAFSTTGTFSDFGDTPNTYTQVSGTSNTHGGL